MVSRLLRNEGSAGEPTYHIELQHGLQTTWSAGDIAVVDIPDAPGVLREYSIASLPTDGRVHLVVRKARRDDGTIGVGSGWLIERGAAGAVIRARVRSNPSFRPPEDESPLILIGNGTGIAGLRSLLKARVAAGHRRNWLVFGERNAAHDAYYRDELDRWADEGFIEFLDLTYSRDHACREYVQHRIAHHRDRLLSWVDAGTVIAVCGSAEGMAPDVEEAIRSIIGSSALQALIDDGRYRRDVY